MDINRSSIKGFTFLEILVSLSIMAIVLTAIFRLHSQTIDMTRDSSFWTIAPLLANSKMSEIDIDLPDISPVDRGDFGESYPKYSWEYAVGEVTSESLSSVSEDLKQIDVRVDFDGGRRTFRLRSYRFVR